MTTEKLVTIEAEFRELKAKDMYKTGRGRASSWPAAASRAIKDLKRQISRKRFTSFRATITVVDVPRETETENASA